MKKLLAVVLIAGFAVFAWRLLPSPDPTQPGTASMIANGKGVVQHVDPAAAEVTIKHGPLPALNMMAMTMTYAVKDPKQLANLRPMQEVEFQASYDGNKYLVVDIKGSP